MENINYIITAKHYSIREGAGGSVKARILKMRDEYKKRGIEITINNIDNPTGGIIQARIWNGQWIADCECGGAQFVDPDEPIYFCFGCANRAHGYNVRPVEFPADREQIEALILARPVNDLAGLTDLERAGLSRPAVYVEVENENGDIEIKGLARNWDTGESVHELVKQNKLMDKKEATNGI